MIHTESTFQKYTLMLLESILPLTSRHLLNMKEIALKKVKWEFMMKCLLNPSGNGLAYANREQNSIILERYKNGKVVSDAITFFSFDSFAQIDVGDHVVNGEGTGSTYNSDGTQYHGQYLNNEEHGQGTLLLSKGIKYEGSFNHSVLYGYGKMTWPDGFSYEGQWKDGDPTDIARSIHPSIVKCLNDGVCTKIITKTKAAAPQNLRFCEECYNMFCERCGEDRQCHPCGIWKLGKAKWYEFGSCACNSPHCKEEEKQVKRKKIT
eukprot:TRINITY_DN5040_c0_g4_i2.p1 TRINITY_DN5040_c0_g4~~TRINITY_DN5040_c0_g4_i2.p1  ORF type:complete len:264 (-),score=39.48 TRINITY_DN5040_c0_g4_i2:21-812(-)